MFEEFDDILTIAEVADALKIGTSYAYRIVKSGKLKAYKDGKDWKIRTIEDYFLDAIY